MNAAAFDELISARGPESVIPDLMSRYPDLPAQARLADCLFGAEAIQRKPKDVRCIGVFYYRISHGGAERVLCDLLRLWDRLGYRTVLFTDFPASPEDEPVPASTKRIVLPDTFALTPDSRAARFRLLYRSIRDERIDCFVHHAWLSKNLLWDLLAVKSQGIPFIQYTHGAPSCLLMDEDPSNMDELPHLTRIYRLSDRVICLSRAFEAFWHHFNPNTAVLLNPCELPSVRASAASAAPLRKDEPPLLLWAGRFAPEKQPEAAVRILSEVRKSMPGVRLALLGSGGEVYRDLENALKEQIRSAGLTGAVEMPGFVSDPTPWYQRASVLLLTSQYEGFSLVIAEAKLHGVPTIMYDLPYLYFAEEKQGLLTVPQGDDAAAARAVVSLLENPEAYRKASADALESSRAFSPDALSAAWQQLFSALSRPDSPAVETAKDPDTAALEMLLAQLHAGLEGVKEKETARQRDAAGGLLYSVFDAEYYVSRYPDLMAAFGHDAFALLKHYLEFGMSEGRSASPLFDPHAYAARYPDLRKAFGKDMKAYAIHFLIRGRAENRLGR